jgi:hypothetical protein
LSCRKELVIINSNFVNLNYIIMRALPGVVLFIFLISPEGYSQDPFWGIRLYSFFDNTEFGHSEYQIPQTMAGVRFSPAFGLRWDSVHSITAGLDMLHEFGSDKILEDIYPTAFYKYEKDPFRFLMGAFPRNYAVEKYPRIFFQDSIRYYRPNINGMLIEYVKDRFSINLWLDWTGRQTTEMHETFFAGFSGKYKHGMFYVQNFTYMFHFAGKKDPVIDEALHDNLIFLSSAGLDLSGTTILDKLDFNVGWVTGLDRARADNTGWFVQPGLLSEARIQYRYFGLFNTFYTGKGQMYYYDDHDNELYWGDPIYRTRTYNRSDIYIDFAKGKLLNIRLIYSLHFTERRMYHEQALKISVDLDNIGFKH